MRKYIIGIIIILASLVGCQTAKAQEVKREGKTFVSQKTTKSNADIVTDYQWQDSKGNTYPIILHKYTKGDKIGQWTAYVKKTSAKTGKEYNYYIPNGAEIAKEIIKEMGIK